MSSTETLASDNITPPVAGQVTALAVTTTASTLDLRTCGNQTPNMASGAAKVGLVGRYVTFYADGGDVGIIFGATSASVATTNAPALATQGTNATGACVRIANGAEKAWLVPSGTPWIGVVGSASCTLRIVASSP
jgi:hypothetical protein